MRSLAKHFNENEEIWGITGLLHDLDMEQTINNIVEHGKKTCEILLAEGYDIPEIFHAIKAHCENFRFLGVNRQSKLDYSLVAAENITGLIVAYTLMRPDKKLYGVEVKSITKKFKDKSFATKINREFIDDIVKIGLSKNDFFEIALNAMKSIASEIGL